MGTRGMMRTRIPGIFRMPGGSLCVDKVVAGRRIYLNFRDRGKLALEDAEREMRRMEADIVAGVALERRLPGSLSVGEALDSYWTQHLSKEAYGPNCRSQLSALDDRLGRYRVSAERRYNELTPQVVERYARERARDRARHHVGGGQTKELTRRVGPRTVDAELKLLSAALNYAVDAGRLDANPVARRCHVRQPRRDPYILDDGIDGGPQWRAIVGQLRPETARLCTMLYETGMRPVEAYRMRAAWLRRLDDERWMIVVPSEGEKTGTAKRIPLSPPAREAVEVQVRGRGPDDLVWPSTVSGEQRSTHSLSNVFRGAVRRAGFDPGVVTPYTLRRTRVTIWGAIDDAACRHAVGHAPNDSHRASYERIPDWRLFAMVGIREERPRFALVEAV